MQKKEITEQFVINLEKERNRLGLTQAEMASALEISTSGYKKIIAGETLNISMYILFRACKVTGKTHYELLGEEHIFAESVNLLFRLRHYPGSLRFINSILELESNFVRSLDRVNSENGGPDPENSKIDAAKWIPVIVAGGDLSGGMLWDTFQMEHCYAEQYLERYPEIQCGIKITSGQLSPVYIVDDIVLVAKKSPRDGDIGVFLNEENGRAYIRRLRLTSPRKLEPVNGLGETFYVDETNEEECRKWTIFGCIVTKMRTV